MLNCFKTYCSFEAISKKKQKIQLKFIYKAIGSHLSSNSEIAANRYLKLQKTNAMYRSLTITDLFEKFQYKENLF